MRKNSVFRMLLILMLLAALSTTVFANATEPPGMLVYVPDAPEDLVLTVDSVSNWRTERIDRWGESYFRTFTGDEIQPGTVMRVETGGTSFEVLIPEEAARGYCDLVTLDLEKQTLTVGEPWWRQPLLVTLRVLLTLVLEGAVLWVFGYRQRKSWLAFLIVNLVTQAALNIAIVRQIRFSTYGWTASYIAMEALIFTVESVAFAFLLPEKSRKRGAVCALAANAASLVLGGLLLTWLPI